MLNCASDDGFRAESGHPADAKRILRMLNQPRSRVSKGLKQRYDRKGRLGTDLLVPEELLGR
jgi:hypothetical protein